MRAPVRAPTVDARTAFAVDASFGVRPGDRGSRSWHLGAVKWRVPKPRLLLPAILALALGAAYSSGLHAPFQFDDVDAVVENSAIRHWWPFAPGLPTATQVAGRPIVALSYALNFQWAGLDPFGYRIVNLAVHFGCALLLFAIAKQLLSRSHSPSLADPIAAAIALLWAVHPLHVGTITYVSARSEALASAAYLGVLFASLRAHDATHSRAWSAVAIASCAVGMATKETMVTAPLLVVLFDRAFYYSSFGEALRERYTLYSSLMATWIVLVAMSWSSPRAASAGFDVGISPWTYLADQGPILTDYLRTALWPRHLVFTYGEPGQLNFSGAFPSLALIALLLAATVWLWVRKPSLGALGIAFFLVLAPTSTIVPIATEVGAERRMYLPLAALIALIVVVLASRAHKVGLGLVAVLSIVLIALTSQRNSDYLTSEALWRSTVSNWPSAVAHRNLGTSLKLAGKRDEALEQFRIAAQERPEVRRIVGQELYELGRFEEATDELQAFLATADPSSESARAAHLLVGQSQLALADARLQARDFTQATEMYRRYLALQPADTHALINLGIALLSLGDTTRAVPALRRATELEPGNPKAHQNLAVALAQQGEWRDAAEHAARAASLAPNDASARELLDQIQQAQPRGH